MAYGKLILVTGYLGAGKTTLVKRALEQIDGLRYLTTVTTRLPRPEEIAGPSPEYEFVSPAAYARRRRQSKQWDHTEFGGNSYGADVDRVNSLLAGGSNIICHVAADQATIQQMSNLYTVQPTLIWIDTPLDVANRRLAQSGDDARHLRGQATASSVRHLAHLTFTPTQNLNNDTAAFTQLVKQVLKNP